MPNRVILVDRNHRRLSYQQDADVLQFDMQRLTLKKQGQKRVLWLLLTSLETAVPYKEIAFGFGDKDEGEAPRAHKVINQLRDTLKAIRGLEGLITSRRSVGYIVGDGWKPARREIRAETSREFLSALDNVVEECIRYMERQELRTMQNGLQYIDADQAFAIQKYQLLNAMLWDTIRALSSSKPSDVTVLKQEFHHLVSYVLFWRIGDNLAEEKWRADYRDEIMTAARRIHRQVEDLLKDLRSEDSHAG